MIHIYAIVLAVVLLIGALAAIIVCVCVDIVPIIKSRGSTLLSRDSVTQEQARMLKKSLQRNKLTSSASADFIDSVQGRKTRATALRIAERPRYGSTPLALLSGEEEKSDEVGFKTTTVIIEALPKKTIPENKSSDVIKMDVNTIRGTNDQHQLKSENEVRSRYEDRPEVKAMGRRSGSSPNVAGKRSKSLDILDEKMDLKQSAMTYNARDPRFTDPAAQSQSHPNSPELQRFNINEDSTHHNGHDQGLVMCSNLHSNHGNSPEIGTDSAKYSIEYKNHKAAMPNCEALHCKWCQMEREQLDKTRERQMTYQRNSNFQENYKDHMNQRAKHLTRQRSFEETDSGRHNRGFPYDRNKYCKNPHRGYSPCPDCFHSNQVQYYPTYSGEASGDVTSTVFSHKHNLQGPIPQLLSSSSSSSSSGSSSRFRLLRQPLEDIQEDASDCYAMRDVNATSTIDSRELESGADDGTIPKSTDNSDMSASPDIVSGSQSPEVPNVAS